MPKVALTETQRRQQRYARKSAALADGLAAFKRRERLTDKQIGAAIGMSDKSIVKLLEEKPVMMTPETFWALLEVAGLEVRPRTVNFD